MSAASAVPHPPEKRLTTLTAACFVPVSIFERCLDLQGAQLGCLLLITVETLGANRRRAEISLDQFSQNLRVSKEQISNSLSALEKAGQINILQTVAGRRTYAIREEYIQEAKNAGRQTVRGRCPDCKQLGEFSTEFIPIPHQALRKLAGCTDPATCRVTLVVYRHTSKWGKESRRLEVEPAELVHHDFRRVLDLEDRQITNGLNKAVELGLIGRLLRPGRPSIFWAIPEGLSSLERREPRRVMQPIVGEKEAKPRDGKTTPQGPKEAVEPAIESRPYLFGRCPNCKHLVPVEPVSEGEFADARPVETVQPKKPLNRAGPEPEIWSNQPSYQSPWKVEKKA